MRRLAAIGVALIAGATPALADARRDCSQDKDFNLAIQACSQLIQDGDATAKTYNNRGRIYVMTGDYVRGIADFTEALTRDPTSAAAYNNRAFAYLKLGQPDQALLDAEKCLALNPNNADALDTRGHILETLGRHAEAIADFRRALTAAPNLTSSREALKRLGVAPPNAPTNAFPARAMK
jgi:tetratricopeptide (TPR) repeat protein